MKKLTTLLMLAFFSSPAAIAEIAEPSEPVGNATDTPVVEKFVPEAKERKLTPKERAHYLAHPHHKPKKVKRLPAGRKAPRAKP